MNRFVPFLKYEGLGNDFIVVEARDEHELPAQSVPALCDRRRGIGADGVLLVLPPREPDCAARMRVINADGSIPEMCGNGVRCVALHLARARRTAQGSLLLDTDAGPRRCTVDDTDARGLVTVDMGIVRVLGERTLELGGSTITVTAADAGNPHAVLFGAYPRGDIESLGPRLATHPDFPKGTNVEFARLTDGAIDLVVWERGVGITLACGTGACATAAVACAKGLAPRSVPIVVRLPGGTLEVSLDKAGRATMRGPARYVFSGAVEVQAARVENRSARVASSVPNRNA